MEERDLLRRGEEKGGVGGEAVDGVGMSRQRLSNEAEVPGVPDLESAVATGRRHEMLVGRRKRR